MKISNYIKYNFKLLCYFIALAICSNSYAVIKPNSANQDYTTTSNFEDSNNASEEQEINIATSPAQRNAQLSITASITLAITTSIISMVIGDLDEVISTTQGDNQVNNEDIQVDEASDESSVNNDTPFLAGGLLSGLSMSSRENVIIRPGIDPLLEASINRHESALTTLNQVQSSLENLTAEIHNLNDNNLTIEQVNNYLILINALIGRAEEINASGFEDNSSYQRALRQAFEQLSLLLSTLNELSYHTTIKENINFAQELSRTHAFIERYLNKNKLKINILREVNSRLDSTTNYYKLQKEKKKKKKKRKKKNKANSNQQTTQSPDSQEMQNNVVLSIEELVEEALDLSGTDSEITREDRNSIPVNITLARGQNLHLSNEIRRALNADRNIDDIRGHIVPLRLIIEAATKHFSKKAKKEMGKFVYTFFNEDDGCFYKYVFIGDGNNNVTIITAFKIKSHNVRREGLSKNSGGIRKHKKKVIVI